MAAHLYRIRFIREAQIERAKPASGFSVVHIPAGREMDVNAASLNFWMARGCVELVPPDQSTRRAAPSLTPPPSSPAAPPVPKASPAPSERAGRSRGPGRPAKAPLRTAFAAILAAIDDSEPDAAVVSRLASAQIDLDAPVLDDLGEDDRMIIQAALADAQAERLLVNRAELADAIGAALDLLAPTPRNAS